MELLVLLVFRWPTYFPEFCGGTRAKPGHKLEIQRMIWIWDLQGFWPYIMMPDLSGKKSRNVLKSRAGMWHITFCRTALFEKKTCCNNAVPASRTTLFLLSLHFKLPEPQILAVLSDENQFERVARNTKGSCERFDLFSWGHACEAYIYITQKCGCRGLKTASKVVYFLSSVFVLFGFCLCCFLFVCASKHCWTHIYLQCTAWNQHGYVCVHIYLYGRCSLVIHGVAGKK